MKKNSYIPWFILLSLVIASCQGSRLTQLEATNQALTNQINALNTQLTQQAILPIIQNQGPSSTSTQPVLTTALPLVSPSPVPEQEAGVVAPGLIFSYSGLLTPWSNKTSYTVGLFGTANVHMVCDPNSAQEGELWIDNKNYIMKCDVKGEGWTPWKPAITVGDHYIYSSNANDKYEFWTVGSTPFTIRNKHAHSDFMFTINNPGIYNLTSNLVNGAFDVYITCQGAQNYNYKINQSTTTQLVLNPAACEIIIRDDPPGTLTPGEIEVSLAAAK